MADEHEELNSQEAGEENTETNETSETKKELTVEDYNKLAEKNKQLYHRAKKAEEEAKKLKESKETNTQPALSREEAILLARGYTDEEVDMAVKLSKVNNVSLLEAVKDDYVQTKVEQRKQKELSDKASLAPSSGSPLPKADKPIGEMNREEHEAYFRKVMAD